MQSFQTPILFLVFNRPDTTRLVLEQIKKVRPTRLFVAADGPRASIPGEKDRCDQTKNIFDSLDWDCEVITLFRKDNLGCKLAVSSAISWSFSQVSEGIILEDDCYPDLSFFRYCSELLLKYRNSNRVKLIGGNNCQDQIKRGPGSYYFSHYPEIWGWASWRRAWQEYDAEMSDLDEQFSSGKFDNLFTVEKEKKYWYRKFLQAKEGKINTWDYQLVYSILKNDGLAISPQVNLVKNVGIENNPTHLSLRDSKKELKINSIQFPLVHPEMVADKAADHYTFLQIYSKSLPRLYRLIKENGPRNVFTHTFRHYFKP